jgi:fused signal recognition particle receptor
MGFNLKQKLRKSSDALAGKLDRLFGGESIEDADLEEAEEILLGSDLGWELTERIIDELPGKVRESELSWKEALAEILIENTPLPVSKIPQARPLVTVVVGVNGAGKTTTIARMAARLQKENDKVLLACADTFRAAAAEQLEIWADRLGTAVLTQLPGSDAAAVAFDAVKRGQSRDYDSVIMGVRQSDGIRSPRGTSCS